MRWGSQEVLVLGVTICRGMYEVGVTGGAGVGGGVGWGVT